MDDWKSLIDQAMQIETTDTIGAHQIYESAVRAALADSQMLLGDVEAAAIIEAIYGALVAYSQTVMLRMKAEDPEVSVDARLASLQVFTRHASLQSPTIK